MTAPRRRLRVDDPVGPAGVDGHGQSLPADGRLRELAVTDIHPNPHQPRKRFDEGSLDALAESIRGRGVLQPIIVRPRSRGGYELVAGERRWRAARMASVPMIPALVDERLDGASSVEVALIENMAREDLSPIEEARTIATLLHDLKITTTSLAVRLGRSRADVAHSTRLLELPDEVIELIDEGALSKGHGKALLTEPDHQERRILARQAVERGWSVRALEAEIARRAKPRRTSPLPSADQSAAAADLEDAVTRATGCAVRARPHPGGYQIILDRRGAERLAQLLADKRRAE